VNHGFDTFMLWAEGDDQIRRFAEDVVPAVRVEVARERKAAESSDAGSYSSSKN
jgi:hypothetical protein